MTLISLSKSLNTRDTNTLSRNYSPPANVKAIRHTQQVVAILLRPSEETLEITRRLDAILSVLLESMQVEGKKPTIKKQIRLLHQAGLRPSEIARILGKTQPYVNSVLAHSREG